MGKVLHSFEELGTAFVPFPELPKVDLIGLADFEAQAEKIRECAGRIRLWVGTALSQLAQAAIMSREARELVEDKITATQMGLFELLGHEMPAYRRAAWLVLLKYEFSRELHSREEVEKLLGRLVAERRFIEQADGELKAYDKAYAVSPDAAFGEPEKAEARKALSGLLGRVYAQTGKTWEEKAEELRGRATIGPQELAKGATGICALSVPPEQFQSRGQTFWRGGGTLLVQSNGEKIVPLDATGTIEGAMRRARDLRVHLSVSSLGYGKPPFVALPEEQARKVQLLWYLAKRALLAETQGKQVLGARTEFASKATVSPEEFFLERKDGVCLVEFQGIWQLPDGSAGPSDLFFLVERKEEGEERTLRIAELPDRLGEFLGSCIGETFPEQGPRFEGVGQPLQAVLKACYGQVAKNAAKTARINGN